MQTKIGCCYINVGHVEALDHDVTADRARSGLCLGVAFGMIVILMPLSPGFAEIHGNAEWIRMVADLHRANTQSILTWKGRVVARYVHTRGPDYRYELTNDISFAYSREKNAVRWNSRTIEGKLLIGQTVSEPADAGYRAGMVRDDRFFRYFTMTTEKPDRAQELLIFEREKVREHLHDLDFDPTYFLKDDGRDIAQVLTALYEGAKDHDVGEWYVDRVDNLVSLETRADGIVNRYVFDVSKGGNMVSYYAKGSGEEKCACGYQEHQGVWLLKSFDRSYVYQQDGKTMTVARTIQWQENAVNRPLEPNEFSIDAMGIKPGDYIQDVLLGVRFQYEPALDMADAVNMSVVPSESLQSGAISGVDQNTPSQTPADEVFGGVREQQDANETVPHAQEHGRNSAYIAMVALAVAALFIMAAVLAPRLRGRRASQ